MQNVLFYDVKNYSLANFWTFYNLKAINLISTVYLSIHLKNELYAKKISHKGLNFNPFCVTKYEIRKGWTWVMPPRMGNRKHATKSGQQVLKASHPVYVKPNL